MLEEHINVITHTNTYYVCYKGHIYKYYTSNLNAQSKRAICITWQCDNASTRYSSWGVILIYYTVICQNIIPQIQIVQSKNPICTRNNVIFHCISLNLTYTACVMEYILYFMYKIYSMARVGSTNFEITKMAGYAKKIDVLMNRMKKFKEFSPGEFGEIFPSVMIFHHSISSLQEIFRQIPLAPGL